MSARRASSSRRPAGGALRAPPLRAADARRAPPPPPPPPPPRARALPIRAGGGGYAFFAGRDASRAYITGEFEGEGLTDDLEGLSPQEHAALVDWWEFYETHETYARVGVLRGRFYDERGEETAAMREVRAKCAEAEREEAAKKEHAARYPACSSRWTRATGSVLWCEDGRVPRREPSAKGGGAARCACFTPEDAEGMPLLELFDGCDPSASTCNLQPAEGAAKG